MSIANFFLLTGAICSIACVVIVLLLYLWDDREDFNPSNTKPGSRYKVGEGCFSNRYRCFDCGAENLDGEDCWNCGRE